MAQAQNYGFHIFPSRTYSTCMLLSTQEEKRDINYCVFQRSVLSFVQCLFMSFNKNKTSTEKT